MSAKTGKTGTDMNVTRCTGTSPNVTKYVFDFGSAVAETVLYRGETFEDRTVICCSTQSGCPVGCRFCGAGDNFVRSLHRTEIVAQVIHVIEDNNINPFLVKKGQIMFMSMGEPLLNLTEVEGAIRLLNGMYSNFSLLVSTSGPNADYARFRKLSCEIDKVGLQFSVHESTDERRNKLIPFKNKLSLNEIALEGELWYESTGRQPFFNYCAHEENTGNVDARILAQIFDPTIWQATISVVCERAESVAAANNRQRTLVHTFMEELQSYGYSVRCFDPAGQDDIGGGCGQLWYVQKWMREHPDFIRKSAGTGLPVLHTPKE